MFLEYDWLVKYNPKVNWDKGTIWFIRCLKIQNKASRYYVQNQESIGNGYIRQNITGNWQETRSDKPRRPSRAYSTFYVFI